MRLMGPIADYIRSRGGKITTCADMANTTPEYRANSNGTMQSRKSRLKS